MINSFSEPAFSAARPGLVVWFTGLSGAGKTTLAQAVLPRLQALPLRAHLLDAGVVRQHLAPDLGFSRSDREENVPRLAFVAGLLAANGVVTLVAAMSPEQSMRDMARRGIPNFLEVFVDAPLPVCEARDPVGLYRRYRAGEIQHLSGLDDPYEAPSQPDVHCLTAERSVGDCATQILDAVLQRLDRQHGS